MLGLFMMTLPFGIAIALSTVALTRSKPDEPEIATRECRNRERRANVSLARNAKLMSRSVKRDPVRRSRLIRHGQAGLVQDVDGRRGEIVMRIALIAGLALAIVALDRSSTASAQDNLSRFQGAWLAGGPDCPAVFSSGGKGTTFKKPVDLFAPAFIISGSRLRTPQASCRIKSVRPSGDRQLMILDCTNSIAGNEVRVLMALRPDGSLRRYFDEQDTDGTQYLRCSP